MDATTNSDTPPQRAERTRLTSMAWAHLLNDGAANYLPGVLPAILVAMNLSVAYAGVFMAALIIGQAAQPLVGLLADRFGGRAFVFAGLVGTSVGGAIVGFVPSAWSLLALLIAIGLCNAMFHPQALAGVRAIGGRHHGTSMSVFLIGGELGRGIWPLATSWLVTAYGLNALWVLAVPTIVTLPLLWYQVPGIQARQMDAQPLQWRAHARPLSLLVAFCALRSLMIFSMITFIPVLWHQQGGALTTGASFITVLLVVGVIGNLGGGRLADFLGYRGVLVSAIIATTAFLVGFILSSGLLSWVLLGLVGIALFATLPLTILIAQDMVPENRSFGSGMALGLANGIGVLCVTVLGPVAAAWGTLTVLWITVACGLAAVILSTVLPLEKAEVAA